MKRQKGQIQPSLQRITEPLRGILGISATNHKVSNIRLLRTVWCVLRGAVEQGWLERLSGCYIGVYSTYLGSHSWVLRILKSLVHDNDQAIFNRDHFFGQQFQSNCLI